MDNWKRDLQVICEIVTGVPGRTWKESFQRLAGGTPKNWKQAVFSWAAANGVQAETWRGAIIGISNALVTVSPGSWLEAFRFIRLFYEGNPPEPLALMDVDGNLLFDSDGYQLFVWF